MGRVQKKLQELNKFKPATLEKTIARLEAWSGMIDDRADIREVKRIKKEFDGYKRVILHLESRVDRLMLRI